MAPKPVNRNSFIDYLPSLLLLWGLLFFQQDVAAQEEDVDLKVEISPQPSCLSSDVTQPTEFTVTVTNIGGDFKPKDFPLLFFSVRVEPAIWLGVDLTGRGQVINYTRDGEFQADGTFSRSFEIRGPIAADISANVIAYYDHWSSPRLAEPESTRGDNRINIPVLSEPLPGVLQGEEKVCRRTSPLLEVKGVDNEDLYASPAEDSYRWEKWNLASASWQEVAVTSVPNYEPEAQSEEVTYRSTTIASYNGLTCESEPSAPIVVETKICQVASNPMMRMQVSRPDAGSQE